MTMTPATTPEDGMPQQDARFAIDGAIAYGRMGTNEPPAGHWLTEYWHIGRQLAKLGETSAWDNQAPVDAPSLSPSAITDGQITELAEPYWLKDAQKPGEFFDTNKFARVLLALATPSPGKAEAERAVDVHALLREAAEQKAARAEQLPTHQDCIRLMVQIRLRLMELGWQSHEYAPKDGAKFEAIIAGFAGPSECAWLGSGFFVADRGDWWPAKPFMWRAIKQERDHG